MNRNVELLFLLDTFLMVHVSSGNSPCRNMDTTLPDHRCDSKPYQIDTGREKCMKYFYIQYTRYEEKLSFEDRSKRCARFGVKLSQPRNRTLLRWMNNYRDKKYVEKPSSNIWLDGYKGALRDGSDDARCFFRWEDGSIFELTESWGEGQPDDYLGKENCLILSRGELHDTSCYNKYRLSCEICIPVKVLLKLDNCTSVCVAENRTLTCHYKDTECPEKTLHFEKPSFGQYCSLIPCDSFRFGPNCEFQCFCKDFGACHVKTGQCPKSKCQPGWKGKACNYTTCPLPYTYGVNCEKRCFCKNGQFCDRITGVCYLGCADGFLGKRCDQIETERICPDAKRCGPTCRESCHCKDNTKCEKLSCNCLNGCDDGWTGLTCSYSVCPVGSWGNDCEKGCICNKDNEYCNEETGECRHGCSPHWTGISCNESFCEEDDKWGRLCERTCDCQPNTTCDHMNGFCLDTMVKKNYTPCPSPSTFGPECNQLCLNERCRICDRNSKGDKCFECIEGMLWSDGSCDPRSYVPPRKDIMVSTSMIWIYVPILFLMMFAAMLLRTILKRENERVSFDSETSAERAERMSDISSAALELYNLRKQVTEQSSPVDEDQNSPQVKGQNSPKVKDQNSAQVKGQNSPKVKGQNSPKVKGQNSPQVKGQSSPKVRGQNSPQVKGQNSPKVKGQNSQQVKG